jgi:hypothetical protein
MQGQHNVQEYNRQSGLARLAGIDDDYTIYRQWYQYPYHSARLNLPASD